MKKKKKICKIIKNLLTIVVFDGNNKKIKKINSIDTYVKWNMVYFTNCFYRYFFSNALLSIPLFTRAEAFNVSQDKKLRRAFPYEWRSFDRRMIILLLNVNHRLIGWS